MKAHQPTKTPGGKRYLAEWIISLFPERDEYLTLIEPYCGGCAVMLRHNPNGKSEIVNDLDGRLTNFWKVLQDEDLYQKLVVACHMTPFSQAEFRKAKAFDFGQVEQLPVEAARAYLILSRQSLAGDQETFNPVSTSRVRAGMNEQVSAWLSAIEDLTAVHERIKRWLILEGEALKVIRAFDKPGVLQYLDPTYLPETRVAKKVYRHEMTVQQHVEMLDTILEVRHAKILISGYPSELYAKKLSGWRSASIQIDNKASMAKNKPQKTETLWMNY